MVIPRQQFWTALLLAIILVTLVIVIIFIFINVCISKRAVWYSTKARPNHYDGADVQKKENQVHHKDLANEKPPLPPRDQFMSRVSVDLSYEDVEAVPDYIVVEGSTPPAPQRLTATPQYTTVETKIQDQDQDSEDYDDIETPAADDDGEDYDDVG